MLITQWFDIIERLKSLGVVDAIFTPLPDGSGTRVRSRSEEHGIFLIEEVDFVLCDVEVPIGNINVMMSRMSAFEIDDAKTTIQLTLNDAGNPHEVIIKSGRSKSVIRLPDRSLVRAPDIAAGGSLFPRVEGDALCVIDIDMCKKWLDVMSSMNIAGSGEKENRNTTLTCSNSELTIRISDGGDDSYTDVISMPTYTATDVRTHTFSSNQLSRVLKESQRRAGDDKTVSFVLGANNIGLCSIKCDIFTPALMALTN